MPDTPAPSRPGLPDVAAPNPAMTRRAALAATALCAACAAAPLRALAALAPAPVAGRVLLRYATYPKLAQTGGSVVVTVQTANGPETVVVTRATAIRATCVSAICTHEGCVVEPYDAATARIVCRCHDSRFDVDGRRLSGPARDPLAPFPATIDPDGIAIDIAGSVAAARPDAPPLASLDAATPDPSRGAVRLAYSLAAASPVRLSIVDALGREVACLVDAALPPGAHAATWDDPDAAPGLYAARLVLGGTLAATRTLTRVR